MEIFALSLSRLIRSTKILYGNIISHTDSKTLQKFLARSTTNFFAAIGINSRTLRYNLRSLTSFAP